MSSYTPRIDCPLCGGELPVPRHRYGTPWSPQELLLIRKLAGLGLTQNAIGRLFGVTGRAVHEALAQDVRVPPVAADG